MTKRTLESPATAVLLHVGLFVFVITALQISEHQAARVDAVPVAAPAPASGVPITPEALRTLRAQAERFGSSGLSGSLELLPALYELSPDSPPPLQTTP